MMLTSSLNDEVRHHTICTFLKFSTLNSLKIEAQITLLRVVNSHENKFSCFFFCFFFLLFFLHKPLYQIAMI